jgi:hypothetical protein
MSKFGLEVEDKVVVKWIVLKHVSSVLIIYHWGYMQKAQYDVGGRYRKQFFSVSLGFIICGDYEW